MYDISPNSKLALDKLVKVFKLSIPETNILIEGHTDNRGTDEYNNNLSQRRAIAVGNYLKSAGIAAPRLTIKWYGESQPKVETDSPENMAEKQES